MAQSVGRDPLAGERSDDPQKSIANRGQVALGLPTNDQARVTGFVARPGGPQANSVNPDAGVNLRMATRGGSGPILSS